MIAITHNDGLVEFFPDGSATLEGVQLDASQIRHYRRMFDDFPIIAAVCPYADSKE